MGLSLHTLHQKTPEEERGAYRVDCYTPDYSLTLPDMEAEAIEKVVAAVPFWAVWSYEVMIVFWRYLHMSFYPILLRFATIKKSELG